jgi:hypothetical protein
MCITIFILWYLASCCHAWYSHYSQKSAPATFTSYGQGMTFEDNVILHTKESKLRQKIDLEIRFMYFYREGFVKRVSRWRKCVTVVHSGCEVLTEVL